MPLDVLDSLTDRRSVAETVMLSESNPVRSYCVPAYTIFSGRVRNDRQMFETAVTPETTLSEKVWTRGLIKSS